MSTVGKGSVCLHAKRCKRHSSGNFFLKKNGKKRAVPVSSGQLFGELIDTCMETIKRRKGAFKAFQNITDNNFFPSEQENTAQQKMQHFQLLFILEMFWLSLLNPSYSFYWIISLQQKGRDHCGIHSLC